jgi:hypothetical protein
MLWRRARVVIAEVAFKLAQPAIDKRMREFRGEVMTEVSAALEPLYSGRKRDRVLCINPNDPVYKAQTRILGALKKASLYQEPA